MTRQLRTLIGTSFLVEFGGGGEFRLTRAVSVQSGGNLRINGPQHSTLWLFPEWRLQAGVVYRYQR